jgi:simple sugar transport system ATP-binding protein
VLIVKGLTVKGDAGRPAVKGVDFFLRKGEILGIAGVAGNGQKELVEALTGLRRSESGTAMLKCCNLTNKQPQFIIRQGVSYIPEDKIKRGVILNLSISDNLALKCIDVPPYSRKMIINQNSMVNRASELISRFGVRTTDPCANVSSLSGGNIQKLIVARELSNGAEVIIAEQPTAGLDVQASEFVHKKLLELRSHGVAILLISADLDEIIKLSDRIIVMFDGKFVGEFYSGSLDMQRLAKMMLGSA